MLFISNLFSFMIHHISCIIINQLVKDYKKETKDIKNKPEGLKHAFKMTVGSSTVSQDYIYQEMINHFNGQRWYRHRDYKGAWNTT